MCVFVQLPECLSVSANRCVHCTSVLCQCLSVWSVCLPACLSVRLSVSLSVCLSACPSIRKSVCLPARPFVRTSVCRMRMLLYTQDMNMNEPVDITHAEITGQC